MHEYVFITASSSDEGDEGIGDTIPINILKGKVPSNICQINLFPPTPYRPCFAADGSDPVLKAEADYPDWLHGILVSIAPAPALPFPRQCAANQAPPPPPCLQDEEQLTISEAVMKGAENLTAKQGKRMLRDIRRAEIKEHNSINKKH